MKKMGRWLFPALLLSSLIPLRGQTTYNQVSKQVASDRATSNQYGTSVFISGDYAVVGAPYHSHGGTTACGSAYVLQRDATTGVWSQIQELYAGDRAVDDHFGWSVCIYANYIIVGAPDEDEDASGANTMSSSGSVYIFKRNTTTNVWAQDYKIVASDRETGDKVGWSVGIFANTAVAGAPYQEDPGGTDEGAIYVIARNPSTGAWSLANKAKATDRQTNDHLGYSVSIYNSEIAAGAPDQDFDASGGSSLIDAGAVYSFMKVSGTWSQTQKIVAGDRKAGDKFGFSVSRHNATLAVGAPYQDYTTGTSNLASNAGAAYIFDKNGTWTQIQKVVASDRAIGDNFGWSVAKTSMDVIVGAPSDDRLTPSILLDAGSIYVFNAMSTASWAQTQKILSSDIAATDNFGYSVSIYDTKIIVGAYNEDENAAGGATVTSAGSAYMIEGCAYASTASTDENIENACIGEDHEINAFIGFGISYQWQVYNGVAYVNVVDDAVYSGSSGPFLGITNIPYCMNGSRYRCKLTSSCGAVSYFRYIVNVDPASYNQKDEVTASDAATLDQLGFDVAISNTYAIAGAPGEDHDTAGGSFLTGAGAAYIYERDGSGSWNQVNKIVASNRDADASFGTAVDIYGDYAIVSAPFEDISGNFQAGAVYIYKRVSGTWTFWQKLVAPVVTFNDQFGNSLAIDQDLQIIVGSKFEDHNSAGSGALADAGAAYVYTFNGTNWNTTPYKIVTSDRAVGDNFGWAVDIDGSYAVISALLDDHSSVPDAGSVYIFERNPGNLWLQSKKLTSDLIMPDQRYGYSVSIYEGEVVVGCTFDDITGTHEGVAYIYDKPFLSWPLAQKINAPLPLTDMNFGLDVSMSKNYMVIGSNVVPFLLGTLGGVFIYEKCTTTSPAWNFLEVNNLGNGFGRSVDIAGQYFIGGAALKTSNTGSAYVFESCGEPSFKSIGTGNDSPDDQAGTVQDREPSVTCYPNPATNEINLRITGMDEGNIAVNIVDMNGRTVSSLNIAGENNKISVEQLVPGVYFIRLDHNGIQLTRKFVKQ